jgi:hypothetical protein
LAVAAEVTILENQLKEVNPSRFLEKHLGKTGISFIFSDFSGKIFMLMINPAKRRERKGREDRCNHFSLTEISADMVYQLPPLIYSTSLL